jgi:hypothetical protein
MSAPYGLADTEVRISAVSSAVESVVTISTDFMYELAARRPSFLHARGHVLFCVVSEIPVP